MTAENLGNADTGGEHPVVLTDVIPHGLHAVGVVGTKPQVAGDFQERVAIPCKLEEVAGTQTASCTLSEALAPYDQLEMRIDVKINGGHSGELNRFFVTGGNAAPLSIQRPITISPEPVPFGIEQYEMAVEEEGGAATLQAGKHPFQFTTTITANQLNDINPLETLEMRPEVSPPALFKDLKFKLPVGFIGNAQSVPQCTTAEFYQTYEGKENDCAPDTAVGVATVTVHEPATVGTSNLTLPIFNLEPAEGEPARFGFYATLASSPVIIGTGVRTGSDYGATVTVQNITQTAAFLSSEVTFWGVPGAPAHDSQRGWGCLYEARGATHRQPCTPTESPNPKPFLTLPTACANPLTAPVEGDSWAHPGSFFDYTQGSFEPSRPLTGCNRLTFDPEIHVAPDGEEASKPTGLTVDVHVPQEGNENAEGYASSEIKDISVTFPEGVMLNPAAANGLQACSETQVGLEPGIGQLGEFLFTPMLPQAFCPTAAKVANVTIKSPFLPAGHYVEGGMYLATPAPNQEPGQNPFNSLIAAYIIAKDPVSGVLVKLPGEISLNHITGQITSTFENNPQLPYEDAEIHLFGGERAPLATPSHCGTYTTEAEFTPWSGTPPVKSASSFQITSSPGGGPCPPASLPFNPTVTAGTTSNNAGAFTPLVTTIGRADGNQNIKQVQLHMPPGVSGLLKGVELCPEAQANAGTCGANSLIGHSTVTVGLGGDPFPVTGGQVFLTAGYKGAPFGLSIVTPAVAGPFNLGVVVVRAKLEVDPRTAAITVTTDEPSSPYSIPTILKGIPLQIQHVNVTIDRPGFTFNPTNCNPQSVTGTIGSEESATSPVSVSFQVTNCAALSFQPKLTVTTGGHASKTDGSSLTFKIAYPKDAQGQDAWFKYAKFDIPKQLPARLTTIQQACLAATFEANPANCPKHSKIGEAVVHTPVLPVPLKGPVYFVSYGGAKFPDAVILLSGYGVNVRLTGETFINGKTGVTSATFPNTPDVPFESIEVTLPTGEYSEFGANLPGKGNYDFCGQKLVMPTRLKAQNGLEVTQNTPVGISGCPKAKTRAQDLAATLKACHKIKNKSRRKTCETTARKRLGPVKRKK